MQSAGLALLASALIGVSSPCKMNMWDKNWTRSERESERKGEEGKKREAAIIRSAEGVFFNVCPTVHTHLDTHSQSAEKPKDSRAPVETVISGVKGGGGGEIVGTIWYLLYNDLYNEDVLREKVETDQQSRRGEEVIWARCKRECRFCSAELF